MNDLLKKSKAVNSRNELNEFLSLLIADLKANPQDWENSNLNDFLIALNSWIEDMDGFLKNKGIEKSETPSWQMVADMFMAARIYE